VTVFVTTHYMEEAEYCDRLALIYRGSLVAAGSPAELKEAQMADQVLLVSCDRPQEAMALAALVPGVRDAALFGKDIHLMAGDADHVAPELRRTLSEAGFQVSALERITPSLEDVFVSLIEARDRAEGAQKEFSR
jgi:ABC-2 type transport system ATP-binding protein